MKQQTLNSADVESRPRASKPSNSITIHGFSAHVCLTACQLFIQTPLRKLSLRNRATGNRFEAVANGVTEIQDGAQTAFRFVLPDNLRLDLTATRHDCGEEFGFAPECRSCSFPLPSAITIASVRSWTEQSRSTASIRSS